MQIEILIKNILIQYWNKDYVEAKNKYVNFYWLRSD